jgi:hypothetical protein
MPNDMRDDDKPSHGFRFWRTPLFRLLAINLAAGVAVAVLLVGGLLLLDPGGLRHLIFADRTPGIALGLLLFGFIVTFGSAAMGSAIMADGGRAFARVIRTGRAGRVGWRRRSFRGREKHKVSKAQACPAFNTLEETR